MGSWLRGKAGYDNKQRSGRDWSFWEEAVPLDSIKPWRPIQTPIYRMNDAKVGEFGAASAKANGEGIK